MTNRKVIPTTSPATATAVGIVKLNYSTYHIHCLRSYQRMSGCTSQDALPTSLHQDSQVPRRNVCGMTPRLHLLRKVWLTHDDLFIHVSQPSTKPISQLTCSMIQYTAVCAPHYCILATKNTTRNPVLNFCGYEKFGRDSDDVSVEHTLS